MKTIPNPQLLAEISQYIQKQGGKNYCLFLLGSQSGLRVSEAVNFSLEAKTLEPNFYLVKSKGKTRSVYISPSVISELKALKLPLKLFARWKRKNLKKASWKGSSELIFTILFLVASKIAVDKPV